MALGVLNQGMREVIPASVDVEYAALIHRCWDTDPARRPSFLEAVDVLEGIQLALTSRRRA
jgi:hypothetical protein